MTQLLFKYEGVIVDVDVDEDLTVEEIPLAIEFLKHEIKDDVSRLRKRNQD